MTSGERFSVIYHVTGNEKEAYAKAQDICVEQTIEYPYELLAPGFIKNEVVGRIDSFAPLKGNQGYRVVISYAIELAANELTQLLNVVFGNISIKPGILVDQLILPDSLLKVFKGPRFGREGLRQVLGVFDRPLLFAAIKPMGLTSVQLADIVYRCAVGGIDIIKDDHGLSNQTFAPFEERVTLCSEAVHKANRETGRNSIYVPNITAPANEILSRSQFAKQAGVGGLLASPALIGLDTMRWLSDEDSLALPIISHPAFQGSYITSSAYGFGFSHYALYGQISRLAGADAVIYPNFGGRFSFSIDECRAIVRGTEEAMGHLKSIFPSPGGGMTIERIPELLDVYGKDVAFLMGGGLFKQGPDLVKNCRYFLDLVEKV
jgi:ribulose-bisphosphate carboxylase large chain